MAESITRDESVSAQVEPDNRPRIKIRPHGSYIVSGNVKLVRRIRVLSAGGEAVAWQAEEDYPATTSPFKLCRCGLSKTKPICDDAHKTAPESEWNGLVTADRAPRVTRQRIFRGTEIIMTDDNSMCADFGFCDAHGGVWKEIKQTADPQVRERLKAQIPLCPSGRLQYMLKLGDESVEIKYEPMIAIIPDGPYWVLGGIPIEAPDGFVYEVRNRQLLCRCGKSKNKPFCDGTHWDINFRAP